MAHPIKQAQNTGLTMHSQVLDINHVDVSIPKLQSFVAFCCIFIVVEMYDGVNLQRIV